MSDAGRDEAPPGTCVLTSYTVQVFARGDLEDRELDRLIEAVEGELHDDLYQLAQRLERMFRVEVVATDEDGASWISGGLGVRPSHAPATAPDAPG